MPITRPEAEALAELLAIVRPNWTVRGIMAGLKPLAAHPAPLPVIAWAAIRCAQDRDVQTPAVIALNGPHWDLSERPREPRLTPELECREHVGKWAGNCPLCHAEKLGTDEHDLREPDDDGLSHLDPRARIREATARAKRVAHQLEADADREVPESVDHDPHTAVIRHRTIEEATSGGPGPHGNASTVSLGEALAMQQHARESAEQEGDTTAPPDPTGSTPTSTAPPNTPDGTTSDGPNAEA